MATGVTSKVLSSSLDLNLPLAPVIGEFTKEELFHQLQDVYNALRLLQEKQQSDTQDLIGVIGDITQRLPKRYHEL